VQGTAVKAPAQSTATSQQVAAKKEARVLAFTGIDDAPTHLAVSLLGLGFASLFAAEGLRRRQVRND